jgi:DNA-directed RNA polymerase subunit RPC12/RpoP
MNTIGQLNEREKILGTFNTNYECYFCGRNTNFATYIGHNFEKKPKFVCTRCADKNGWN